MNCTDHHGSKRYQSSDRMDSKRSKKEDQKDSYSRVSRRTHGGNYPADDPWNRQRDEALAQRPSNSYGEGGSFGRDFKPESRNDRGDYCHDSRKYNYRDNSRDHGYDRREDRRGEYRGRGRDSYGGGGFRRDGNDRGRGGFERGGRRGERGGGGGDRTFVEECTSLGAKQSNDPTYMSLETEMNALTIENKCKRVSRYHITMVKKRENGKERDLTKTPKNDAAAIEKEQFVYTVVYKLVESFPEFFGENRHAIVYDGGPTLYSLQPFSDFEKTWDLSMDEVKSLFRKKDAENKCFVENYLGSYKAFVIEIRGNDMVDLRNLTSASREAQKFYDVLLSAPVREGNYLNYGLKSYDRNDRLAEPIGSGKEVRRGLEKTTKVMGNEENPQLILQVEAKTTAFHKNSPLLSYIAEYIGHRTGEENLVKELEKDKNLVRRISEELRNIHVRAVHNERTFILKRIASDKTPADVRFLKDGKEISVKRHFKNMDFPLRYDYCPMAVEQFSDHCSFYPLEILEILPGSRIGTSKLGNLADEVHKKSQALPDERKTRTIDQLEKMNLIHKDNPYLKAFGVKLDSKFFETMALVLYPPMKIGFGNQVAGEGSKARLNKFFEPADVRSKKIILVEVDRCFRNKENEGFWRAIRSAGESKGMRFPEEKNILFVEFHTGDNENPLESFFLKMKKENPSIMFFFTKEKKDNIHHAIKYYEALLGVQTEHISFETARKCCQGRGATATIQNVLRKTNPKLGGINDALKVPENDINAQDYFKDRWFMGLELSHPATQSESDRQFKNAVSTPTVVGMAYSMERLEKLSGRFYFQQPRIYNIKYIEEYIEEALSRFRERRIQIPSQLVIFRQGASDGELNEVEKEIEELRAGCKKNGYNPKIIYLLCIYNTGTILIPKNILKHSNRARDMNVPSGTIREECNLTSKYSEFEIKSQESNLGTSKMTRVIVMKNDPKVPLREIEKVVHWCAFAHQPSTMPTSKPHVLYAAKELAKRGTEFFKYDKDLEDDKMSRRSGSSGKAEQKTEVNSDDPYKEKSSKAICALQHHFWA